MGNDQAPVPDLRLRLRALRERGLHAPPDAGPNAWPSCRLCDDEPSASVPQSPEPLWSAD